MSDTLHKLLEAIEEVKAAWGDDIQIEMLKKMFELCRQLREEMER